MHSKYYRFHSMILYGCWATMSGVVDTRPNTTGHMSGRADMLAVCRNAATIIQLDLQPLIVHPVNNLFHQFSAYRIWLQNKLHVFIRCMLLLTYETCFYVFFI